MTIRQKRWHYRLAGAAILLLFALFNAKEEIGISGNEASRFATVQAVAEFDTFAIERSNFRTVDKLFFDGHLYSDKPPFQAWVTGMLLKPILKLSGWNFVDNYYLLVYLVNFFWAAAVMIPLFWWLFNMLCRSSHAATGAKFLLALLPLLASWVTSYAVVINNHTPAALCVTGILCAVWKYRKKPTYTSAAAAALSCGLLGAFDIPGGVIFSLALIPALIPSAPADKRIEHLLTVLCIILGSALGLFILNYVAFRQVLPLYMVKGGSYSPGIHDKSHFGYAIEALIGFRGIFSYQPFLLLALPGVWMLRKRLFSGEWVLLAASVLYTIFYIFMTNEFGGAAYGFRYLIPVIPLWSFYAGRWVLNCRKTRLAGAVAALLLLWGGITSAAGAYFPFCCAFEGYRTPAGHFSRVIRSTFTGNLLCWSYENLPDSPLTTGLIKHYGREAAGRHLFFSYFSMKNRRMLEQLSQDELFRVEKDRTK